MIGYGESVVAPLFVGANAAYLQGAAIINTTKVTMSCFANQCFYII